MARPRPILEFVDGSKPPIELAAAEAVLGRAPGVALRVEAAGVAAQHARLIVDGQGGVWLEDLGTPIGTTRNGRRVSGREPLADGDRIEVGAATLLFRAADVARGPAPTTGKAGSDQATMVSTDLPEEVRNLLAARAAGGAARPAAARPPGLAQPARPTPASVAVAPAATAIVGTPDPEPEDNRTVQMEAPDFSKLGVNLPQSKSTKMGMPILNTARPATPQYQPQPHAPAAGANPFATAPEMPAPAAAAANPFATASDMPAPMYRAAAPTPVAAPTAAAPHVAPPPSAAMGHVPTLPTPIVAGPASTPYAAPQSVASAPPQAATAFLDAPQGYNASPSYGAPQPVAASQGYGAQQGYGAPQGSGTSPTPQSFGAAPGAGMPAGFGTPVGTPQSASTYAPALPATPSAPLHHGFGASINRSLSFVKQMFAMAGKNKVILKPILYDIAITTPLSVLLGIILFFVNSESVAYAIMTFGVALLYFTDYACNSITASLIFDEVTTGRATVADALPRVKKAVGGVMIFAAVSSLLDVASTYARERDDVLGRILLNILRSIWTTATYVIMPAMVLEGISFGAAFARSKQLMAKDPTGVGAGIVAMSLASYIVGIVVFPLAYFLFRFGLAIHLPSVGVILFFTMINLYWSVSGWLKISYSTCFYLWARECDKQKSTEPALAPEPLRNALLSA